MASSAIELRGVYKAFGGHQVIEDLSLAVPEESIYAFIGNNGEGKSTTIRALTAVNAGMAVHQQHALLLAAGLATVLLPVSAWIFGRREVLA